MWSFVERSVEETEENPEKDGNNTATQKKLGLDISMIGAREETLGKPEARPMKCPL